MKDGAVAWIVTLCRRREVAAGIFLVVLGLAVGIAALELNIGTPARMGAGFLPLGLGILLCAAGIAVAAGGIAGGAALPAFPNLRPLAALIAGFAGFALLIEPGGLAPAAFAGVFISSLATRQRHWFETVLYSAALAAAAVLLFVVLLDVPIRVWPAP